MAHAAHECPFRFSNHPLRGCPARVCRVTVVAVVWMLLLCVTLLTQSARAWESGQGSAAVHASFDAGRGE